MFKKLKAIISTTKDERELIAAAEAFDELMARVDEDELVLAKLERQVRDEFEEIEEDVKKLSHKVDGVIGDKAA